MDSEHIIDSIFGVHKALIGMIHVQALPGTPRSTLSVAEICDHAVREARLLKDAGFHGLMIENMHDRPYLKRAVGPEVVAVMTAVGRAVQSESDLPLGVQILGGANRDALATAVATEAAFVRTEGFAYAQVADEGLMDSDAGELLRYRRTIAGDAVKIFVDIKKKHSSHAITSDIDLVETARTAEFFLADGVVVTGTATGRPADPRDVAALHGAIRIPTLVGSGVTPENLAEYSVADAVIVGTVLKRDGLWSNPLAADRLRAMVDAFASLT